MGPDVKDTLWRYLQVARESMLWKLDGLSEFDRRRPMTPTATNLAGIVKHLAGVESEYLGLCFGRPFPEDLPWLGGVGAPNADMWLAADESTDEITELYRRVGRHSEATVAALALDAEGRVPWWPEDRQTVSLGQILVHLTTETHRHAGQADIVRELIDGAVGLRPGATNLPEGDQTWRSDHFARVDAAAALHRGV